MAFPRGFKARCEALSLQLRHRLRLGPEDVLPPDRLADELRVTFWSPRDLANLPVDVRRRLEGDFRSEWSAITLMGDGHAVIVCNPAQSHRRRTSSLMHELAHILLDHTPGVIFVGEGGVTLRTHDPHQEEEADWLAGCLLLPREALLAVRKRGASDEEICDSYGVSAEMLRFRMNMTGVERQLRARRRPALASAQRD